LVHAIERREARLANSLRRLDVRRDHALLDQPMRLAPLDGMDRLHLAVHVELDLRLREIEVDRAALAAGPGERAVDVAKAREHRQELRVRAARLAALEERGAVVIGEAGGRAHDRAEEAGA